MDGRAKVELITQISYDDLMDWLGCRARNIKPELTDEDILKVLNRANITRERLMATVTNFYYLEFLSNLYPRQVTKRRRSSDPECRVSHEHHRPGYVYIAQTEGVYKIGYTASAMAKPVAGRLHSVQLEMQGNANWGLVHAIFTTCAPGLEKYLHNQGFKRIWGEFFELTPANLEFIRGIKLFDGSEVIHYEKDFSATISSETG